MLSKNILIILFSLLNFSNSIINATGQPNPTPEELWQRMATEVDSWIDALGKPIDEGIKDTVIILNLLGFKTSQSCEGHMDWGVPCPWVDFEDTDEEIYSLNEKRVAINQLIKEKEQALVEKYPNKHFSEINMEDEAPELLELYRKIHETGDQVQYLSRKKLIKLKKLINKFYKNNQDIDYDRMLILSDGRLITIGSDWQVVRDNEARLEKLKEYQKEMNSFAQFLKNKFRNKSN